MSRSPLYVESKKIKQKIQTRQNENTLIDTKNQQVVARGKEG